MTDTAEADGTANQRTWLWIAGVFGVMAVLLGALALYFYRDTQDPANDSADVGFTRDMSTHHAQAVEMANIVYRRTQDPEIALIARDIADTQQFQIGMMTGWLDIWGRSVSSDQPIMGWMGDFDMTLPSPPPGLENDDSMAGMDMSGTPTAGSDEEVPLMPGMATQSEVDQLNTLPPGQMDIRFLQLMIRHHQGGVMMAEAALEKARDDHVLGFAQQVINTQSAEIATMTQMLNERIAASPTPDATPSTQATPTMDMPGMATPAAHIEGH